MCGDGKIEEGEGYDAGILNGAYALDALKTAHYVVIAVMGL